MWVCVCVCAFAHMRKRCVHCVCVCVYGERQLVLDGNDFRARFFPRLKFISHYLNDTNPKKVSCVLSFFHFFFFFYDTIIFVIIIIIIHTGRCLPLILRCLLPIVSPNRFTAFVFHSSSRLRGVIKLPLTRLIELPWSFSVRRDVCGKKE